ncbi:MAG: DUF1080 domain-containing protein [Planctomycetaceae bacterium]|jgi:hypothetical protein|nr:DUF1080 domain-containing protein [Planctomycetaceae bacterium]
MKYFFDFFVSIIFVILSVAFAKVIFAQIPNIPNTLPASKQPDSPSPSEKSSTNPYTVLVPKFSTPQTTPANQPPTNTNTTPKTTPRTTNSRLAGSDKIESISPYDSGQNIILNPDDTPEGRVEGRKTRKQIAREKAKKAIEAKLSEDKALARVKSIIGEYDPERQSYENDLARLIEIDIATSGRNNDTDKKTKSDPSINSVTKNPDASNGFSGTLHNPESVTNNSLTNTDSFVTQWERELVALMKSNDSGNKSDEILALSLRIERRKQFLARQAESLVGANIFEIDSSVKLIPRYLEDGWCNLFDGKTLFGWRVQKDGYYGGGRFTVVNGEICSDPQYPGLLYTTNQFGDSAISFEYCADKDAELFLLYRTSPNPRDLNTSCYTVVLNSADRKRPRGTILGRVKLDREQIRSITESDQNDPNESENNQQEKWHRVRITCDGGAFSCTIDRQLPTSFIDLSQLGRGYIGLLVTRGKARFRNLIWRAGTSHPLFDGINVKETWRYKEGAMTVTAANSAIQLRGGPGVIETLELFSDFVLQFEYKIENISGKAGLFFRANPRDEKSGYEISLQNSPSRKDRDELFAIDAGSFAGRKSGRYVGAEDLQWNYFTLSAIDRQFQTWVNGIPVCEMTDKSKMPKMVTVVKAEDTVDGKEIVDYVLPAQDEFHNNGTIQFYTPTNTSSIDIRNIRIIKIAKRTPLPKTFGDRTKTTWNEKLQEEQKIENEKKLDQETKDNK